MSKQNRLSLVGAFTLFVAFSTSNLYAQTFQNSNTPVETELVPCDDTGSTGGSDACNSVTNGDAHSIDCGLLDDDAYPDCAVYTGAELLGTGSSSIDLGVLINLGTSSVIGSNHFAAVVDVTSPDMKDDEVSSTHGTMVITNQTPTGLTGADIDSGIDGSSNEDIVFLGASGGFLDSTKKQGAVALSDSDGFIDGTLGGARSDGFLALDVSFLTQDRPVLVSEAEKSAALFDCDGDGDLDLAFTASNGVGGGELNININSGTSLDDITGTSTITSFFADTATSYNVPSAITVGNFNPNTDSIPDIAIAINGSASPSELGICFGTSSAADSCTYTCSAVVTFNSIDGSDTEPFSITSGDYDGDGFEDVAVANKVSGGTAQVGQIYYFFGNGTDLDSAPTRVSPNVGSFSLATIQMGQIVTGYFNNDDVPDVAYTMSDSTDESVINIITSDGSGGFNTPEVVNYAVNDEFNGTVLAATDIDLCGGDDIVALSTAGTSDPDNPGSRRANLFLNTNEAPTAAVASTFPDAGAVGVNGTLQITASCTDSTSDAMTFSWSATCDSGAGTFATNTGNLNAGETDASTTFTPDSEGSCTLTLTCTDLCSGAGTTTQIATVSTQVCGDGATQSGESCDSGVDGGTTECTAACVSTTGGGTLPGGTTSQGSTLWGACTLNPNISGIKERGITMMISLGLLSLLLLRRRQNKKTILSFTLLLSFILAPLQNSQALTKSFSVNNFNPAIDDSEFFGIYNALTLRQRDYHVGMWLDYANRPYEVGSLTFSRVSGIVDHLLTANIVGSYGVTDWFNVGARLPIFFFQDLNSPLLGLSAKNVDLGDAELMFKFRLLDRREKKVGISVIPYVTFPTSTDSGAFLGNGGFSGGGKLAIDTRIVDRVTIALNVGYEIRERFVDVGGNVIDDHFLLGAGVSVDIIKNKLKFIGEVDAFSTASELFSSRRTSPMEVRAGMRYTIGNGLDINLGGAMGLTNGVGSPRFRVLAGATYTKRPLAEVTFGEDENVVTLGDEITSKFSDRIYFEYDSDKIRAISKPTLDKIAAFIKAHDEIAKIRVEGHTCDLGSNGYNQSLSQKRAAAVRKYMIDQGISSDRLASVGFGESKPLVENKDEQSREQNRRVQMFVEQLNN